MIVITPTELRAKQKMYFDLAEREEIVVKRGSKLIHLVVQERTISDEDLRSGITGDELLERLRPRMKKLFDK